MWVGVWRTALRSRMRVVSPARRRMPACSLALALPAFVSDQPETSRPPGRPQSENAGYAYCDALGGGRYALWVES